MSQMVSAKKGKKTEEIKIVSVKEGVGVGFILEGIRKGTIVIIPGKKKASSIAIGDGLRSKVLCNLGTSSDSPDIEMEIRKAKMAIERGASIICDQSVGPGVFENRKKLIKSVGVPIASVPLYQTLEEAYKKHGNPLNFEPKDLIIDFEQQIINGISAPAIHPITKELKSYIERSKRIMPIISRGGALLSSWIEKTGNENPYIQYFDKLLDICVRYDVPLTFVCVSRAGCIEDGFDDVQIFEWRIISKLIKKAHKKGVSVAVDGLGHMRIDQIPKAVDTFKKICFGVPLGTMGPATTDRALGHEHVAHAIGAAIAIFSGANYCQACCRTEHLGLPEITDIPDSIGAFVIASHVGDLGKYRKEYAGYEKELKMAQARKNSLWGLQLSLALEKIAAIETFNRVGPKNKRSKGCSICGDFCPFVVKRFVKT